MHEARVSVVKDAGHHLYLDNPEAFNKVILDELLSDSKPSVESDGNSMYVYMA